MRNGFIKPISLLVVTGVRPQYIKCAALQKSINEYNQKSKRKIDAKYINSGQHYDDQLSGVFIREFDLHFDYTIQHENKYTTSVLGNMIFKIGEYIHMQDQQPHWVVVFGDANTTLAGAIAGNKSKCSVAHFEAGTAVKDLRTPEIINGRLIAQLADIQFCSTELAAESLRKQGINKNIYIVGDIARDFVIQYSRNIPTSFTGYKPNDYILLTIHREENLENDETLRVILDTLRNYPLPVLFVTHPRTKQKLVHMGINEFGNLRFMQSLSYRDMLSAIKGCRFIITDSGGLQREAYYLGKRCLVNSDVDFWPSLRIGGVHKTIKPTLESIKEGLSWVEEKLGAKGFPVVEEMDRSNVAEHSLSILDNLTS